MDDLAKSKLCRATAPKGDRTVRCPNDRQPDSDYCSYHANKFDDAPEPDPDAEFDDVEHPSHYCRGGIEPIQLIRTNPHLGFLEGTIIEYVFRWMFKGGISDLKKARQNLDWLIEDVENSRRRTREDE